MTGNDRPNKEWWDNFKRLLNEQYDWPAMYTFKFIAPKEKVNDVRAAIGKAEYKIRASSRGTYQSVTAFVELNSAEEVIAVYGAVGAIEDVVAL